jgi:HD-GYP domain-containing protein (c-di-GMP phosphodiesterase class II)
VSGELWGAINLEEDRTGAFDEDDVRLVETVADQVGAALRSAFLYEQLDRAYMGTAEALAAALEAKDSYTAHHAHSIVEHAEAVGRKLGMDAQALRDLRYGAVFHDIGKIAVPEAILNKRGPLTPAERREVERHTIVGEQILAPVEFLAGVRTLVRHEHERWDGTGYPDGLAGEAIPLGSRIILACDAFHAMTSDRPYRAAMRTVEAIAELRRNAGSQFDPRVVAALLEVLSAPLRAAA